MRCENKINMWILQIMSQQMCFCLRVLRRTTGFFISRANAPRVLREILFLVQNTLDCYGNFFFPVRTTLDCYGKFLFPCERPSITQKKGAFLSQKHSPKTNQKNEVLFHCHAPQQNSTMSCAVKILRNMLSG